LPEDEPKLTTGVPALNPIEVKSLWHMIGIDFVGPLAPPSHDGHRYILTISVYFTKWVEDDAIEAHRGS